MPTDRLILSSKYAKGSGIELGALCFPWPLQNGISVRYLDLFPTEKLKSQYPEHKDKKYVDVSIIDDGTVCSKVETESQEFLFSSHVLEHSENAIDSIKNWLRVVKTGGHVIMAVPEKTKTFDHRRPITQWPHFLEEYLFKEKVKENRREHYSEYYQNVDNLSGKQLEDAVTASLRDTPHIHFHTWTWDSIREFFGSLETYFGGFTVMEMEFSYHEVFVVIRKDCLGDPKW